MRLERSDKVINKGIGNLTSIDVVKVHIEFKLCHDDYLNSQNFRKFHMREIFPFSRCTEIRLREIANMKKQEYLHANRFFSFSGHCQFNILCLITNFSYLIVE